MSESHKPQQHHDRLRELFDAALELTEAERPAFLERACGDDATLRAELEELLEADRQAERLFPLDLSAAVREHALRAGAEPTGAGPLADLRLGPYRLTQKIGEGGASVVYQAVRDDDEYFRRVAVKLLRLGLDSERARERFQIERQILAALDHPNIARLLDGGTTPDGVPYLVMEHVEGRPIDRYCEETRLSVRGRLELFRRVCDAVQYAHRNLIVHRDLKPTNILVRADGEPKLLDFGIAKLLNPELAALPLEPTRLDARLLTPEYASPEQVRGEPITTASDVYSLGVLLYELLAGRHPYPVRGRSLPEIAALVCEHQPLRPSLHTDQIEEEGSGEPEPQPLREPRARPGRLDPELDTIVLKALRKEAEERYPSVEQLAEDLHRHLTGLPIAARPATPLYRFKKFARRNRLTLGLAAGVMALLLAFGATMALQLGRIAQALEVVERERASAEHEGEKAEAIHQFLQQTLAAANPELGEGRQVTVLEALQAATERIDETLGDQPEIAAAVRHTIGVTLGSLGRFDEAEALLRRALDERRELFGEEHAEVAESLHGIGMALYARGAYEEAERYVEESLELRRKLFGEEHLDTALSINDLGLVLQARGDREGHRRHIDRALEIRRSLLTGEEPELAESLSNVAVARYEAGDLHETASLFRTILELDRRLFGDDHANVANDLHNLAGVLLELGNAVEAERLLREAELLHRQQRGEHHPAVQNSINGLSLALLAQQRHQEAEVLQRQALQKQRELLEPGDPRVASFLTTLGLVLQARGEAKEAEALFREALLLRRQALGDEWPTAMAIQHLGHLLVDQGRHQEALPLFEEALEIFDHTLPYTHWRRHRAASRYARCLTDLGRYAEAEPLLLAAERTLSDKLAPDHPLTLATRERLVTLYEAWGKPDAAARFRYHAPPPASSPPAP